MTYASQVVREKCPGIKVPGVIPVAPKPGTRFGNTIVHNAQCCDSTGIKYPSLKGMDRRKDEVMLMEVRRLLMLDTSWVSGIYTTGRYWYHPSVHSGLMFVNDTELETACMALLYGHIIT